jgi:hypothetical protein
MKIVRNDETVAQLLDEIIAKMGPYDRDSCKHADNVIQNSSELAREIKNRLLSFPFALSTKGTPERR